METVTYVAAFIKPIYSIVHGRLVYTTPAKHFEYLPSAKEGGQDTTCGAAIRLVCCEPLRAHMHWGYTHGLVNMMSDAPKAQRISRKLG